jgi:hypothetical protein
LRPSLCHAAAAQWIPTRVWILNGAFHFLARSRQSLTTEVVATMFNYVLRARHRFVPFLDGRSVARRLAVHPVSFGLYEVG